MRLVMLSACMDGVREFDLRVSGPRLEWLCSLAACASQAWRQGSRQILDGYTVYR